MLENLAILQLEAQNFTKMECHITIVSVVMPAVMGMRLIRLALQIPICYVWVDGAGRHLR